MFRVYPFQYFAFTQQIAVFEERIGEVDVEPICRPPFGLPPCSIDREFETIFNASAVEWSSYLSRIPYGCRSRVSGCSKHTTRLLAFEVP
jgi:hypothetical protein